MPARGAAKPSVSLQRTVHKTSCKSQTQVSVKASKCMLGEPEGGGYGNDTYESIVHITIRIRERFCFVEYAVHVHGPVAVGLVDDAANTTCGGTVSAKNSGSRKKGW
jgi:hypothetical protein